MRFGEGGSKRRRDMDGRIRSRAKFLSSYSFCFFFSLPRSRRRSRSRKRVHPRLTKMILLYHYQEFRTKSCRIAGTMREGGGASVQKLYSFLSSSILECGEWVREFCFNDSRDASVGTGNDPWARRARTDFIWPVNYIFHKHRVHAIQRVLCLLGSSTAPTILAKFIAPKVPQREYTLLRIQVTWKCY